MSVAAREARARGVHHVLSPVDRSRSRSALGTHRGDVRRGSVSSSPALASPRSAVTRARALPLATDKVFATLKHFAGHGSSRRRHQHGAGARCPSGCCAASCSSPSKTAITRSACLRRHAELQRGGRRAVARQPLAARGRAAPRMGIPGIRRLRLLRGRTADQSPSRRARPRRRGAPVARGRRRPRAARPRRLPHARRHGQGRPRRRSPTVDRAVLPHPSGEVSGRALRAARSSTPTPRTRRRTRPQHQALALEAARKSIVLLKNAGNGLLPLDRAPHQHARRHRPQRQGHAPWRLLHAIPAAAWTSVRHLRTPPARASRRPTPRACASRSTTRTGTPTRSCSAIRPRTASASRKRSQVAAPADAIVLVIGTNESTSREAWADNHLGDVADLSLMSQQGELVDAMLADRQAGHRRPQQRPPAGHPRRRRARARHPRSVVRRAGRRDRASAKSLFGDRQSRRQAAGDVPTAHRRSCRSTTTGVRRRSARISI